MITNKSWKTFLYHPVSRFVVGFCAVFLGIFGLSEAVKFLVDPEILQSLYHLGSLIFYVAASYFAYQEVIVNRRKESRESAKSLLPHLNDARKKIELLRPVVRAMYISPRNIIAQQYSKPGGIIGRGASFGSQLRTDAEFKSSIGTIANHLSPRVMADVDEFLSTLEQFGDVLMENIERRKILDHESGSVRKFANDQQIFELIDELSAQAILQMGITTNLRSVEYFYDLLDRILSRLTSEIDAQESQSFLR